MKSISIKQLMALTGLGLSGFVLVHMLGNLLVFVGPEAYNTYSNSLTSNRLIYVAEAGLLGMFILHLLCAIKITVQNKRARPVGYQMAATGEKATPIISKTMLPQGVVILVFVIYHLVTFKFGRYYSVTYDGHAMRDLHRLFVEIFHDVRYAGFYIFCLIVLGLHLSHGFASMLQSLGITHPKYECLIKKISWSYAALVTIGFISQPVYVFFFHA